MKAYSFREMAKKDKEEKKAAKAAARERVNNRLAKGKNVSVSDIADKTGVSEKRAQRIINRADAPSLNSGYSFGGSQEAGNAGPKGGDKISANKYFERNDIDPGKKLGKGEAKAAMKAGVSAYNLGKFADNLSGGASDKAQAFLDKKQGQVSTKMKDYDTATAGGKNFTKADIRYLMSEEGGGHSMEKIQQKMDSYQNDTSVKVGRGAQDFLDKKVAEMKSSDDMRLGSTDEQAPPAPPAAETPPAPPAAETPPASPAPTPPADTAPVNTGNQDAAQGFLDGKIEDVKQQTPAETAPTPSRTSIGDSDLTNNGQIFGNVNQGSDFSVNISGGASDNTKSAADYMAINDNAFAKSQSQMSGLGRASQAIAAADAQTGAAQGIANTDYATRMNSLYMGAKATAAQTALYGDIFKFEAPEYKMPKPGKKPEDKQQEIADSLKI